MSRLRRWAAALVILAATGLAGAAVRSRLADVASTASLVSPDEPYVRLDREITADFGMENPVVWVLEARQGTVWTPTLLARLRAMTREVFTIPGVIAPDVLSLASPNLRDVRLTDDGLEQVYLMGEVPETPEALAAFRQRVETDPNYQGNLVSTDGRALMVVANFSPDGDAQGVADAALALRDRYRDAEAAVYVTGAPVLLAQVPDAVQPLLPWAIAIPGAGVALLVFLLGMRAALAALLAAAFAVAWTVIASAAAGGIVLPWTVYALLPTALIAAGVTTAGSGQGTVRVHLSLAVALAVGFAAAAFVAGAPARAFGVAGAIGGVSAVVAGLMARAGFALPKADTHSTPWLRVTAGVLVALALLGLPRLGTSFGLRGYGERYLPADAVTDLRAVARLFPPPTMLVVRVRGESGFVTAPAVLHAFDGLVAAARAEAAVRSAMSLADLVKMVNRAFNDNRAEFLTIPDDQGMVGRYLTLAYSPNFRRFVDRALATSTIWIYLNSDRPQDIARVLGRLEAQLAAQPVPNAEVDLVGGDGAGILVMARTAERLTAAGIALVLIVPLIVGAFLGVAYLLRSLLSGAVASVVAAGALGWIGAPIDLVSLPIVISAGLVGAAFGALSLQRFTLALAVTGGLALVAPSAALNLMGILLLAPAVGMQASQRGLRPQPKVESRKSKAEQKIFAHRDDFLS
jgi:hypothetical protein